MNFVVLDTETNWNDKVMSLGMVVASSDNFNPLAKYYYVFDPEYRIGGIFSSTLHAIEDSSVSRFKDNRVNIMNHIKNVFTKFDVSCIFAYNAKFDKLHLPELSNYSWYDIMKVAAYKQHNKYIPDSIDCFPNSGRIRRGFGVEPIYRMVTGRADYKEKHNGYHDAIDELVIMRQLGLSFEDFRICLI